MLVKVGISTSDKKSVGKNFNTVMQVDCIIKDKTTILNPVFVLTYNKELTTCNYAYVEELGRYYYLGNAVIGMDGSMEIPAMVDVLMSWQSYILNLKCIIERQEKVFSPYIFDGELLTRCDKVQETVNVGTVGIDNNLRYYLVTTGG